MSVKGRWLLVLALVSCSRSEAPVHHAVSCQSDTHDLLRREAEAYPRAIARAQKWLDELEVDPIELRKKGIKGKKKLVEVIDGYYRLAQLTDGEERERIIEKVRARVAVTYTPDYHDMARIDDKTFKQDATSYLRAAVLLDRLGVDVTLYKAEIAKIQPRLDAHMHRRGSHQRLAFGWYYRHFGLKEPFPLGNSLEKGIIARRADPNGMSTSDAYDITHEIFVPYEYGERLDVDPFTPEDKAYLQPALATLIRRYIEKKNADILAELVSCMRFLRFIEDEAYREGIAYLLASQNPDGSWGDLQRAQKHFGAEAPQATILHTTMVVIDALTIAFHWPWNESLYPGCSRPD